MIISAACLRAGDTFIHPKDLWHLTVRSIYLTAKRIEVETKNGYGEYRTVRFARNTKVTLL